MKNLNCQDTNYIPNFLKFDETKTVFMKFLRFHKGFFALVVFYFIIEVIIALYVRDQFIRPYMGDVIVIWFVYYFIRTFINVKPIYIAVFTLLFAFAVEIGQCFKLIEVLGLQNSTLAKVIIGTSFSWGDIFCYIIGFLFLFLFDKDLRKKH